MEKNKKTKKKNLTKKQVEQLSKDKLDEIEGGLKGFSPKETQEEWIDLMQIPKD